MTAFQYLVFVKFQAALEREPHEPHVPHDPHVATADGVFSTLETLEAITGRDDHDAMAYKRNYGWIQPAWEAIVQGLGISLTDYAKLLEFKQCSDSIPFIEDGDEEPEQALRVLESSTFPVELQAYKEPLVRLLECLVHV